MKTSFETFLVWSLGLLVLATGEEIGGCHYITFSRRFGPNDMTQDIYDPGTYQELVWAYGSTASGVDQYHDRNRGHVELGDLLYPPDELRLKDDNCYKAVGTNFDSTRYDCAAKVDKNEKLQVFWKYNGGKLDFALEFCMDSGWEGWVGVGLSPDGHMQGMDVTMISIPSCSFTDRWGESNYGDPVIDEKQDVWNYECSVSSERIPVVKEVPDKDLAERERQPLQARLRPEKGQRLRTQFQRRPNPEKETFEVYDDEDVYTP